MKKINRITLTMTAVILGGYLSATDSSYASQTIIPYVPGQTTVNNGDIVSYNGECFIAQNSPGLWESPSTNSWFWQLTQCDVVPEGPEEPEVPSDITLTLDAPENGQQLIVEQPVDIRATVTGDLAKNVAFYANNVQLNEQSITAEKSSYEYQWTPSAVGVVQVAVKVFDQADQLLTEQAVDVTVDASNGGDVVEPPITVPGDLCSEFNVYPDWTRGDHATNGDIMVHENIAYSAVYWTQSVPGSDGSWALHLNCDGTEPGTAPLVSLPNPSDPVHLELPLWPSTFVVTTASQNEPAVQTIELISREKLADTAALTTAFVALIEHAEQLGATTVILDNDVLSSAALDSTLLTQSVDVKNALSSAADITGVRLDSSAVNALTNDVKGWALAHQLVINNVAPQAIFGWSFAIGDFALDNHSGRQSVWDSASQYTASLLHEFGLYQEEGADFVVFTPSTALPALNNDQWHNALEHIKQVTDFVNKPAMLAHVSAEQSVNYFMGTNSGNRQLRKAAFSNIFALQFDQLTPALSVKIDEYQDAKIPLYYVKESTQETPLTRISSLNQQLEAAESAMDNKAFLYETPQSGWVPSTVYKWADFLEGLNAMHNIGIAGNTFWLLDDNANDEINGQYAKVAIAAFLAQSMQETIRYNACDENNWSEVKYGAPTDYPMTASCGQLGQKYADYGVNPVSGLDYAYSCPRDNKMELSALTHAKWYGAPAPVFAAPDAVLEERGLLVDGHVGRWTNDGHCNQSPSEVDMSKQVWERNECQVYVDQKAGKFIWDGSSGDSVEGCGWWGRGVIQTTGRQNFGTLNHYLGRSHVDPATIGQTIDGVTVEAPPANPLYAGLDFCSNPGLICSSEENAEIKWIAGLFYWVTSVQAYADESGKYGDWNYHKELKAYVDGGLVGTAFIDAVSGIVNRGCPDSVCSTGEVHAIKERQANFKLVLQQLGLNPQ